MRCFQVDLFSRFLPPSYAGHVNLAGEKPSRLMLNCKYEIPVEIVIFLVQYLFCLTKVSNIMIRPTL